MSEHPYWGNVKLRGHGISQPDKREEEWAELAPDEFQTDPELKQAQGELQDEESKS